MVRDPTAVQVAEEILDLVDRNGIADADVHAASLFERAAAVDADQPPLGIEHRPARVARIDRGVGLQTIGIFQNGAGGILIAMHAGDHAVSHGRPKIGGQQERIADREAPIAHANPVAVGQFGVRKIGATEQLDQSHVARGIESHDHGVV